MVTDNSRLINAYTWRKENNRELWYKTLLFPEDFAFGISSALVAMIHDYIRLGVSMIQIIETNLSIDNNDWIKDHQSRLIEFDGAWKEYCYNIHNGKSNDVRSLTGLSGNTLPKNIKIVEVISDDFHLKCKVINGLGFKTVKLSYLVRTNIVKC